MSEGKYEVTVRPEKAAVVDEMKEQLSSQGVVLVAYNKLDVKTAMQLRRTFLKHGVQYKVIKNTLTRIAANDIGIFLAGSQAVRPLEQIIKIMDPDIIGSDTGQSILNNFVLHAMLQEDPVAPAAALKEFLKETKSEAVAIKAGVLDGKVIDPKAVKALADLPSKEQLLGMVASALLAPITGLACALNGNIQNLAYALEAVRKQKESA